MLDPLCRECGAPARLYVTTKRYFYTIALAPSGKVQAKPYDLDRWTWFRRDPARERKDVA